MKYRFIVTTLLVSLIVPSFAGAAPDITPASKSKTVTPGDLCHETLVQAVVLEELSLSFALVAKADKAIVDNNFSDAAVAAANATAALELASSRGAAARTTRLIDAVLDAKSSEDNKQLLDWFPMLHTAIFHMPSSAYTKAADKALSRSEEILSGDRDGDAFDQLKTARHWLSCDRLDNPLNDARQALSDLSKSLYKHEKPDPGLFEAVYAPLGQAIQVMFAENGE